VEAVVEVERRRGRSFSLDALIILGKLRDVKRATLTELMDALQNQEANDVYASGEGRLVPVKAIAPTGAG
jgi:hypothetical protein